MKANFITLIIAVAGFVLLLERTVGLPMNAFRIAGLVIAIPSFVLFALARIQLGGAFSVQAKATTLVTSGLYARIRNPIYVFGGLMVTGIFIWAEKPWYLLCFLVVIPLQLIRARKEEQVLTERFGAVYLEYKRKTWF